MWRESVLHGPVLMRRRASSDPLRTSSHMPLVARHGPGTLRRAGFVPSAASLGSRVKPEDSSNRQRAKAPASEVGGEGGIRTPAGC